MHDSFKFYHVPFVTHDTDGNDDAEDYEAVTGVGGIALYFPSISFYLIVM